MSIMRYSDFTLYDLKCPNTIHADSLELFDIFISIYAYIVDVMSY